MLLESLEVVAMAFHKPRVQHSACFEHIKVLAHITGWFNENFIEVVIPLSQNIDAEHFVFKPFCHLLSRRDVKQSIFIDPLINIHG